MQREGLWAIILAEMTPIHQSPNPASRTAHVPDGCRVYAIGDIHGRADLLRRLHLQIMEDAANAASLRKVVVYVGDYVDRGPESATVINMLINEPLEGFEVHHLKGNHEGMMIDFLETGEGDMWMMNGAKDTLASYGLDVLDLRPFQSDFNGLSGVLEKALPDNHRAFLDGLELFYLEGDYMPDSNPAWRWKTKAKEILPGSGTNSPKRTPISAPSSSTAIPSGTNPKFDPTASALIPAPGTPTT